MIKIKKLPLLLKILIAIILGIVSSLFFPEWLTRIFITINSLFSNYLGFVIPLLIVGLVAPGIAELGRRAGKLLLITVLIAYVFTLFSGFLSYVTCYAVYPSILDPSAGFVDAASLSSDSLKSYFEVSIPPLMDVMTALVLAFVLGLGLSSVKGETFKNVLTEFREVIILLITKTIIPILPLYIFGIFLKIGAEGSVVSVLGVFFKVILLIFIIHIAVLLIQFTIAGAISRKNPIKALITMLPAYVTALGTQSSAATIPVTLAQAKKNGVDSELADFVIPLCATIHLSGSTLKIVACALAISWMMGMPSGLDVYAGFIMLLGIVMVAAPGVPGGAIMASLAVLQSVLGFDSNLQGMMIALYIAMDSFGTACNVTGDGAIALIMNRINSGHKMPT